MRFNPAAVGDIGEVTSPPYDVMDWGMIDALLSEHPNNIVRLILPRMVDDPVGSYNAYAKGANRLKRWRSTRVLMTDAEPALYVYEYGDASHRVCGLIGALELRRRSERVVLPHEDVVPGIVADRLAMMSSAEANLEPILLVYDGGGGATRPIIDAARAAEPFTDVQANDGTSHRLWAITDAEELTRIRDVVAPHQALIADGHHRYATYLQLQRRHHEVGDGPGPWDRGLALLIDQGQSPLLLGAVHRSIAEVALHSLTAPAGSHLEPAVDLSGEMPARPTSAGEIVLTDGSQVRRLRVHAARADLTSDAELLHETLLPAWGISEDRVGYHHTVTQTLRSAHQDGGLAVIMHPPTVAQVMAVARAGKMMPRKSTSFGPKPRTGLVMRSFEDEL